MAEPDKDPLELGRADEINVDEAEGDDDDDRTGSPEADFVPKPSG